jgi:hypothetical protein
VPEKKDTIVAILAASAALAGLLLVFVGFVYARGEGYSSRLGDRFKNVAKAGVLPFLLALACTWLSVECLMGSLWAFSWSIQSFKVKPDYDGNLWSVTLLLYLGENAHESNRIEAERSLR